MIREKWRRRIEKELDHNQRFAGLSFQRKQFRKSDERSFLDHV